MEMWRQIQGTHGAFEVSNDGRVRSNLNNRHISDVINGKRDHAAGYRFYREVV